MLWLYLKIRNIWRPGDGLSGTRDSMAQIRDIPGNPGRVATLGTHLSVVSFHHLSQGGGVTFWTAVVMTAKFGQCIWTVFGQTLETWRHHSQNKGASLPVATRPDSQKSHDVAAQWVWKVKGEGHMMTSFVQKIAYSRAAQERIYGTKSATCHLGLSILGGRKESHYSKLSIKCNLMHYNLPTRPNSVGQVGSADAVFTYFAHIAASPLTHSNRRHAVSHTLNI